MGVFQSNVFQNNVFQGPHGAATPAESFAPAAGGFWPDRDREKEWRKRRKKLQELEEIIARAAGLIPADVPQAKAVKEAAKKVEAAVEELGETPAEAAPALPPFDTQWLVAAVNSIQQALRDYKAARHEELRRRLEEDDEDVLLLLED